jgi:hypothetical protein
MSQTVRRLDFDIESLPVDVFELTGAGLEVESLTAGHGILENGASSGDTLCCSACVWLCIRCSGCAACGCTGCGSVPN